MTLLGATEENKISQPIFNTVSQAALHCCAPDSPLLPPYTGGKKQLKLFPHLICKEDTSQLGSAHAHTSLSSGLSCFVTADRWSVFLVKEKGSNSYKIILLGFFLFLFLFCK